MGEAMTDGWSAIVCSRGHGCRRVLLPRTEPLAEWEARRHANEARYWARCFDEFVRALLRMRRNRGDERVARLVRDVLAEIAAAQGADAAVLARDRLSDVWRCGDSPASAREVAVSARRRED